MSEKTVVRDFVVLTPSREVQLEKLLHRGLNLCARARQFDDGVMEKVTRETFPETVAQYPERYHQCITPHLWIQEQYDKDLAEWEADVREILTTGDPNE